MKSQREEIVYSTKKCSGLTDAEIQAVSRLFSNNYGIYSKNHPDKSKRGKQIRLGERYYRNLAEQNDCYVALACCRGEIVGQAFYILENSNEGGMTWVIQLVVEKKFRRQRIAKRLLFSIWGFSNDRAWGLATTNPLTIKTLEAATLRKVSLQAMQKNIMAIKHLANKVNFVRQENIHITDNNATVYSDFYVSHDDIPALIKAYGKSWIFGPLDDGYEWLAFVFKNQELKDLSKKDLDDAFEHSERCLVDAYSRMDMQSQAWAGHTEKEVDFIKSFLGDKTCAIADLGCGTARHIAGLVASGYENCIGFDFSEQKIETSLKNYPFLSGKLTVADCRHLKLKEKKDVLLCLYDVIGSFSDESQNLKIVESIRKNLKKGGLAFISVMNMELTRNLAHRKNIFDVYKEPKKLFKLKASDTMQKTGNIFNPDYFVIDEKSNVVFRKEMFRGDGFLDAEYIIRDRRYTMREICSIVEKKGFQILDRRYVQAGNWDIPLKSTDLKAKEILLVLKKK